ncbi:transketolase family protein [Nocardiopsis ansamitocini]|uniref:Transketolase n=1 Tax=Nocardiopsis ansamitocini TaxID=1670832 RepID=A0A9W6ULI1_9ACTN|nr:transketolase [Nocardiopsis ansamitocini]GLU50105.1 transketolase [Nocardiopsis ansamitocini]
MSTMIETAAATAAENQRDRFYRLLPHLLAEDDRLVAVLAEIGVGYLDPTTVAPVADRVVNVGIREQLMVGVAGGLALAGLRPIVHTFAPFLLERPFEQVKLDLGHQDVGAVLVSAGASYDWPEGGETHFGHRDVALLDLLANWTVHVPGHPDEAEALLRGAAHGSGRVYLRLAAEGNARALDTGDGRMRVLRRGTRGTVIAVGPMADRTLAATTDLDVTVLYAATVRPFDDETLRATLDAPDVVLVEPYLRDTSSAQVSRALRGVRHRVVGLGVGQQELRRYGTAHQHDSLHGLDEEGLRRAIAGFLLDGRHH